jgi:lysophospholipase L1-like esterase
VEVSVLIDTVKDEVSELTKKDIVIFCGGANNVDRSTAGKGLSQVMNFLRTNQHTNILISIPYSFDQKIRLSMNEDIRNYNGKLNRLIKLSKRAHLINAVTDRHFFTRHGMHMNAKGKEAMVTKLMKTIQVMFDKYESHMLIPLS